uniref:Sn1-specific diacylglycerol lipase beta n=1 Tax=Magallana gigas TaxID=29159 RepID=K1PTG8_MAGGI
MPGLIAFRRRWGIGSDDFVFPALLELFLRLVCYNASVFCRDFVCSVILGKDFIPRLGLVSMEDLKAKTLQCIANSKTPKNAIQNTIHAREQGCFEDPAYFAEWKDPKDFTEILVCPEMISDHFPDKVLKSLELLSAKNFTPHSRNPGPIDDTKV